MRYKTDYNVPQVWGPPFGALVRSVRQFVVRGLWPNEHGRSRPTRAGHFPTSICGAVCSFEAARMRPSCTGDANRLRFAPRSLEERSWMKN